MCCNYSILKQTQNGMLVLLKGCGNYQLTFNNLNFSLTKEELDAFKRYLKQIDVDYWEKEYKHSIYQKKIPIPTLQNNLIILINRFELNELLFLMNTNESEESLTYYDFKNNINWN
ncbi:DUF6686 family protein [Flavobacterium channae]|uniref:DUF6686 family protein n=1 Tax=Flavobacterium channae TaxID=2897181 RepID=UPI0028682815|nr:DUF6686 family protein [Flavobacterium channae]